MSSKHYFLLLQPPDEFRTCLAKITLKRFLIANSSYFLQQATTLPAISVGKFSELVCTQEIMQPPPAGIRRAKRGI
jgi:hypothetical protein